MSISVIIPAYNESQFLPKTISSLRKIPALTEIIVVDDGSSDDTFFVARQLADVSLQLPYNCGKGAALHEGCKVARGDILIFIDSDLEETAEYTKALIDPVVRGETDLCIAAFPPAPKRAGFGLAKGMARKGIYKLTGMDCSSPLSGQRAMIREVLPCIRDWNERFGIEVGITIDVIRAGFRVKEVPIAFSHRETGRNFGGFVHRGKQFFDIGRVLGKKWLIF
jgi:glycosyltransferase involved in cell wall biosynthesis